MAFALDAGQLLGMGVQLTAGWSVTRHAYIFTTRASQDRNGNKASLSLVQWRAVIVTHPTAVVSNPDCNFAANRNAGLGVSIKKCRPGFLIRSAQL